MYPVGGAGPDGAIPRKRLSIGATVAAGQIVCTGVNDNGFLGDPASVNDYTEAVGVCTEAGVYATSTVVRVWTTYVPFQLHRGLCSNGVTAGTALAGGTDEQILTQDTASTTVLADTAVGTSEFVGGLLIALTGNNAGRFRTITSHVDNTSTTVNRAFTDTIAVGDTVVRTFGPGRGPGLELTTDFTQFNMKPGAAVDLPDTGNAVVRNVYIDGDVCQDEQNVRILNPTDPQIEVDFVFSDHFENQIA